MQNGDHGLYSSPLLVTTSFVVTIVSLHGHFSKLLCSLKITSNIIFKLLYSLRHLLFVILSDDVTSLTIYTALQHESCRGPWATLGATCTGGVLIGRDLGLLVTQKLTVSTKH